MSPSRRIAALVVSSALVLGAGCGNDADETGRVSAASSSTSTTGTSTTSEAPASTSSSTAPATDGGGPFAATTVTAPGQGYGLLTTVKATADGRVDRVTFEFEGSLPGWRVGYVERPIVQDGSGDEIDVEGAAVVEVHFEPASGFDTGTGEGRQVYKGPNRLDLATRVVVDAVRAGDFEASLVWAIGLDAKTSFRVRADGPHKVLVEFEVPASP